MAMTIDAASISLIQAHFLTYLGRGFSLVTQYALNLLYIFTGFEIVVFGLLWAFQQEAQWGRLFFKVIKIGIIFFIIDHFVRLMNSLVNSFSIIGSTVSDTTHLGSYIFNPALLWKYGYDSSLALLQAGAASNISMGLAMIQVFLGMGILLCFALLGIQVVLQVVSFYFVSLMGLIFLPLGVFSPTTAMFEQVVSVILKAGVRVTVLLLIVGTAVTTWQVFRLDEQSITLTVNQALGLFDTALLFAFLGMRMPAMVASVVGRLHLDRMIAQPAAVVYPAMTPMAGGAPSSLAITNLQAATTIPLTPAMPGHSAAAGQQLLAGSTIVLSSTTPSITVAVGAPVGARQRGQGRDELASAYQVNKSISDELLNKIGSALRKGGLDDRFKDDGR